MRLGDLDYAQKQLTIAEVECGKNFQTDCNHVRDFLNALPTIDAVPVVRCKDCKHCSDVTEYFADHKENKAHSKPGKACFIGLPKVVYPDDFCSYGERKDGEV